MENFLNFNVMMVILITGMDVIPVVKLNLISFVYMVIPNRPVSARIMVRSYFTKFMLKKICTAI